MTVQKLSEATSPTGVGRRTLVTGSAWAVPVVAVGAAAPMAAASPCVIEFSFSGDSCKCPGTDSTYTLQFCAKTTNGCVVPDGTVIYIWDVRFTTGSGGSLTFAGAYPIEVTVNGKCEDAPYYTFSGSGNSANFLEVVYSYTRTGPRTSDPQVASPPDCATC